jgi:hypothetical protein
MAPKVSQQKGKGATSGGGAASTPLPKESWEGSWVIRINVIRRGFGPIFHGDQTNSKIAKENSI